MKLTKSQTLHSKLVDMVNTWRYSAVHFQQSAKHQFKSREKGAKAWGHQYEGEAVAYKRCAIDLQKLLKSL